LQPNLSLPKRFSASHTNPCVYVQEEKEIQKVES